LLYNLDEHKKSLAQIKNAPKTVTLCNAKFYMFNETFAEHIL